MIAAPRNSGAAHRLVSHPEIGRTMKSKTRHRKSYKWRKKCNSSPVAKGRRTKIHGVRNPRKAKRAGGRGLGE
jgi:hypothetical protein